MPILDIFLENPIWQSLWIVAMLILLYWLTFKDDKKTVQIIMISLIFWIMHFVFMWIYSAAIVTVIWLIRLILSMRYKWNKKVFSWVIVAVLITWFYTYENYYSLLPMIAAIISAYWFFFLDKIKLRLFMYITSIFWFIFNMWNWLIWWIVNEIIAQIILLTAMYKMIHDEWKNVYIIDKVFSIFHKPKFDVWRYIYLYDYISISKRSIKDKIKIKFNKIKKIMRLS